MTTGHIIQEKAGELLARIEDWSRAPLIGANPPLMQAQALGFIAEALALVAARTVGQDEWVKR